MSERAGWRNATREEWDRASAAVRGTPEPGGDMTTEPQTAAPLGPACTEVRCSWQPIPHVHEGRAVYPADPADPTWVVALATDKETPHD